MAFIKHDAKIHFRFQTGLQSWYCSAYT